MRREPSVARYDRIGRDYQRKRRADPRFVAKIEEALADCITVLNVGAGLNCAGYGSSVAVTAGFGFAAAARVLAAILPA